MLLLFRVVNILIGTNSVRRDYDAQPVESNRTNGYRAMFTSCAVQLKCIPIYHRTRARR